MIRIVHLISSTGSTSVEVWKAQQAGGKLHNLVRTVAVVSSNPGEGGLDRIVEAGFPKNLTHSVDSKGNVGQQLLTILDLYKPDYFHQFGWIPFTPREVIERYNGLNQHLGPGGRFMYGVRRVYTHMRFCEETGRRLTLPVFCQKVAPAYDEGEVVFVRHVPYWELGTTPEEISRKLFPFEYEVQVEALFRLSSGNFQFSQLPRIAENPEEERLLDSLKKEARDRYPNHQVGSSFVKDPA